MGERGAEIGAVDVDAFEFRQIDFFTARAKHLEAGDSQGVAQAYWQDLLAVAQRSGAVAVHSIQELLVHFGQAGGSLDVPRVDKAVEVRRLLVELEEAERVRRRRGNLRLVSKVLFLGRVEAGDHLDAGSKEQD